jgi:serine/threonine protein kinase
LFVSRTGWIRIADFGFAKEFGTPYKKFTINACTIEYRAPEIFLGTHYYTEMSDIWSLGCVLAYIFTGKPLFRSENKSEIELLSEIFYLAGTPDVRIPSPRRPTGRSA